MATVRDLVKGSLRLIGAVATGETPSAEEQADALAVLSDMLDSWSAEGLVVYAQVREEFTLTPDKAAYTWGAAGDFNSTRPVRVAVVNALDTNSSFELPVQNVSPTEWAAISDKTTTGSVTSRCYLEGTYPLETVNVYPVPSVDSKLVIYSWKPLASFANSNATVDLPPGYAKALRYCLALELAPEYGKQPDPAIVIQAAEAKENVMRSNLRPTLLTMDLALLKRGSFNVYTGE